MAEYYLTYKEFSDYIDECILSSNGDKELLKTYKAEIVAAFLNEYKNNEVDQNDAIQDLIDLWKNQIREPSELLLGKRYIAIQSSMVTFLKDFITSGIIEGIVNSMRTKTPLEVGVTSSIVITYAIYDVFKKTKKLDDWDFCVFLQARTHFHENREFTIEDLKQWFPQNVSKTCNMHNDMWRCSYYKSNNDSCDADSHLNRAIASLLQKDILKITSYRDDKEYYQFVK